MADDSGLSKSEKPTDKKIKDSRKKGQVAQSKELTLGVAIIVILCGLWFFSGKLINQILCLYEVVSLGIIDSSLPLVSLVGDLLEVISNVCILLFLLVGGATFISLLVNLLQIGGIILSAEVFHGGLGKLNPASNFKQLCSLHNLAKFFKNLLELTVMFFVIWLLIYNNFGELLEVGNLSFIDGAIFIIRLLLKILVSLLIAQFVFALVDWFIEKRKLLKNLMMTKDEVRRESKETDIDPELKSRRRELHQEILNDEDVFSGVLNGSSFVLANPTHIAVIVLYLPKTMKLPMVVFKLQGDKAKAVIALATKKNVLVVRDKWLARQMFNHAIVGHYIPKSLTIHIAQVINKNLIVLPKIASELAQVKGLVKPI